MATGMNNEHIRSMAFKLSWREAVHYNVSRDFITEDDPRVTLYTSMCSKVRCSSPRVTPLRQDVSWPRVSMWVVVVDGYPQPSEHAISTRNDVRKLIVEENIEWSLFLPIAPNPRRSQSSRGMSANPLILSGSELFD